MNNCLFCGEEKYQQQKEIDSVKKKKLRTNEYLFVLLSDSPRLQRRSVGGDRVDLYLQSRSRVREDLC